MTMETQTMNRVDIVRSVVTVVGFSAIVGVGIVMIMLAFCL